MWLVNIDSLTAPDIGDLCRLNLEFPGVRPAGDFNLIGDGHRAGDILARHWTKADFSAILQCDAVNLAIGTLMKLGDRTTDFRCLVGTTLRNGVAVPQRWLRGGLNDSTPDRSRAFRLDDPLLSYRAISHSLRAEAAVRTRSAFRRSAAKEAALPLCSDAPEPGPCS